jgi:phage-related protein
MYKLRKPIEVKLLEKAKEYFDNQNEKIKTKFLKSFDKTQVGMKGEWLKLLKGSNGIWEFRMRDHQNYYRIFAFWDSIGEKETLILCTHGFNKKSNKTPQTEIRKAEGIKKAYFKHKYGSAIKH